MCTAEAKKEERKAKTRKKKKEGEKYKSELHGNENELGRRQRRAAAQLQRFICLRLGHNPSHKVRCVWQQHTPLYLYTSPSLAWHMFDAPSAAFLNISNFPKHKNKLRIDSVNLEWGNEMCRSQRKLAGSITMEYLLYMLVIYTAYSLRGKHNEN